MNVNTDESQSSEVARALGYSGEMSVHTWVDEATGTGMPWKVTEATDTVGLFGAGNYVVGGSSWIELPAVARKVTTRDSAGKLPPLVPTPEAVERWGHLWWRQMGGTGEVVLVMNFSANDPVAPLGFYEPMSRTPRRVEGDCFWAGPVLERPVKKEM